MPLDIDKHKTIFIQILKSIYTDNTIGPILGFKGGTAAYLFYDLDRFSVDLDFDLLDPEKEDYVFQKIEKIISVYGTIKEKRKKRYTLFFELAYDHDGRNIKIEINCRNFGSKYEIMNYYGISMKVMTREDMFANKLVAMNERMNRANRDIFDVRFFLHKIWPINEQLIIRRTNISLEKLLMQCIEKLENLPERSLLAGMGELLNKEKKDWIRKELKEDVLFLLKSKLGKKR